MNNIVKNNVSVGFQTSSLSVDDVGNTKEEVFNPAQNDELVDDSLSSVGRLFHADGPA